MAIPSYLFAIFVQAFVMFYFIGVNKLVSNVYISLTTEKELENLFDIPPEDLTPYIKKVKRFVHHSTLFKRKTVPWSILIIILGMMAFLLGGAHDTNMVSKIVHVGVVYGFVVTMCLGVLSQWIQLKKSHLLLRELKYLFGIQDTSM